MSAVMRPVEGIDAGRPPRCPHCDGTGIDAAESDGRCNSCCGLQVECADWWWEIAWLRNQITQLRQTQCHAEGDGALLNTCVMCLEPWPCMTVIQELAV